MSFLRKIKDIQIKLTPWYIIRKHYITILGYNSKNIVYWWLEDLKFVSKDIKRSLCKKSFYIILEF